MSTIDKTTFLSFSIPEITRNESTLLYGKANAIEEYCEKNCWGTFSAVVYRKDSRPSRMLKYEVGFFREEEHGDYGFWVWKERSTGTLKEGITEEVYKALVEYYARHTRQVPGAVYVQDKLEEATGVSGHCVLCVLSSQANDYAIAHSPRSGYTHTAETIDGCIFYAHMYNV